MIKSIVKPLGFIGFDYAPTIMISSLNSKKNFLWYTFNHLNAHYWTCILTKLTNTCTCTLYLPRSSMLLITIWISTSFCGNSVKHMVSIGLHMLEIVLLSTIKKERIWSDKTKPRLPVVDPKKESELHVVGWNR